MAGWQRDTAIAAVLLIVGAASPRAGQQDPIDPQDVNRLANFVDLDYPRIATMARIQGVVVVQVVDDRQGRITGAKALSGNKLLVDASLENVRKWTFKPGSGTSAVIVYNFNMNDGACHDSSRSLFLLHHWNLASITACSPVIVG